MNKCPACKTKIPFSEYRLLEGKDELGHAIILRISNLKMAQILEKQKVDIELSIKTKDKEYRI